MTLVDDYITANAEWESAKSDLANLTCRLKGVAHKLDSFPDETCFSRMDGEPEPPLANLMVGFRLNADVFPTPSILQAAIRRRLEARQAVYDLWGVLPDGAKVSLREPRP